jgi:hypothetical protein
MPELHNHRLFISHAWKYSERYLRAIQFLNAANNFRYSNYSVPEDKAFEGLNTAQLKEQLRRQIRPVEVCIIIGGMYVSRSDWIQFEIDFAKEIDKPILGIRPRGAQVMPKAVSDAADEIVNWSTESIVAAIRRLR